MLHYVGSKAKGTKKLKIKTYQVTIIEYFPRNVLSSDNCDGYSNNEKTSFKLG